MSQWTLASKICIAHLAPQNGNEWNCAALSQSSFELKLLHYPVCQPLLGDSLSLLLASITDKELFWGSESLCTNADNKPITQRGRTKLHETIPTTYFDSWRVNAGATCCHCSPVKLVSFSCWIHLMA